MINTGWHYSRSDGESKGPVSLDDLQTAIRRGEIKLDDLVWHASIGEWKRVASVSVLNRSQNVMPKPPGPTPPPIHEESDAGINVSNDPPVASFAKRETENKFSAEYLKTLKPSTLTAMAMVAATALLPLAMFGFFMLLMMSSEAENAKRDSGSEELFDGITIQENEYGYPYLETAEERDAREGGQALAAFLGGLCCPIIPYGITMIALGGTYLAFRSSDR